MTFYQPPSGGYIGCQDADGKRVVTLYAGYITFGRGLGPEVLADSNWEGIDLSTIKHRPGLSKSVRKDQKSCPVHGMPILANIGCEACV